MRERWASAFSGVTHEAMQLLLACRWRGNVRELDNALQRAVILGEGPLITPADLPPDLVPVEGDPALVDDLGEAVRRFEKQHIERILRRCRTRRRPPAGSAWDSARCIAASPSWGFRDRERSASAAATVRTGASEAAAAR